ncbi:hypothetical protein SD70_22235 [Gordoniibacillus kamchatkensis]|uniref:AB hydrolase-1 domain-containing protein n=1 Tax=Gordoniibacillus kamchatkensis TaxID=1590651 RepID=A0ABR5AEM7_9BACL|nr:alpha/beta hydrolase [Paenibacillus sp. VKM B-2647]KIL39055.1 hypothetical protein SD70_22235 [Paenibacillus sp. VKM B-2647]
MPYAQAGDLSIYYEISGNGFPLLLLHGMSNNSQSWVQQLAELQHHFTVIAWDAPGYGRSSDPKEQFRSFEQFADVLKAFIDKLGYKAIYLLGHSMGAAIAIELSSRYPELVKALILADATRGASALSAEENERRLQNRLKNIGTLTPAEIADRRIGDMLAPQAAEEVRERAKSIMAQIRPAGYKSVAYSLSNAYQTELLPRISMPALLIYGELDKVTPVSDGLIFHRQIAHSLFRIVPNAGHLCYQEDPKTFNGFVIEFLTGKQS